MNALPEKEPPLEMVDFQNETPRTKNRHLKIEQLHEEDHTENIYKGCCNYSTDKRLLILATQIGLSSVIIVWCASMIALKEEDNGLYMSLISSTLSFWMGRQHNERV
jgi:hypothetical protein